MTPQLLNNRYRIIQALGSGGFGDTFLAEDTHMPSGRRCVIKQLKPVQNDPAVYQLVKERFQREAAILEELGDASNQIPRLYAYFELAGQFYLLQEWIPGVTLAKKVEQEGRLSESSVKAILVDLLPVLDYVHRMRIVHRDIKPDNIILHQADNKPVLIDFGAVKETMGTIMTTSGHSAQSIVIGTPGFMPSEQTAGRPVYSTDLFSLGLTAIYALTGKPPQALASDPATGNILWHRDALSVSPSFAAILDKAVQPDARDRFSTAREMLDALQSNVPGVAPTVPYVHPLPSPSQARTVAPESTQVVSPAAVSPTPAPSSQAGGNKSVIVGSLIAGSLVASAIVLGFVLTRNPQPQPEPTVAQQPPSPTPSTSTTITPVAVPTQTQSSTQSEPPPTQFQPTIQTPSSPVFNTPSSPPPVQTPSSPVSQSPTPSPVNRPSPTEAVQTYYSAINQGQLQAAWNQLSTDFQSDTKLHPEGFNSYTNFWQTIERVEVDSVTPLEATPKEARVMVRLKYFSRKGKVSPESLRIKLIWDEKAGRWFYDDTKPLR